jgi:hypothetical protein
MSALLEHLKAATALKDVVLPAAAAESSSAGEAVMADQVGSSSSSAAKPGSDIAAELDAQLSTSIDLLLKEYNDVLATRGCPQAALWMQSFATAFSSLRSFGDDVVKLVKFSADFYVEGAVTLEAAAAQFPSERAESIPAVVRELRRLAGRSTLQEPAPPEHPAWAPT